MPRDRRNVGKLETVICPNCRTETQVGRGWESGFGTIFLAVSAVTFGVLGFSFLAGKDSAGRTFNLQSSSPIDRPSGGRKTW